MPSKSGPERSGHTDGYDLIGLIRHQSQWVLVECLAVSVCVCVCVSVSQSVSVCRSVIESVSVCVCVCVCVCQSVRVCQSVCLSVCESVSQSVCESVCVSLCLSVCDSLALGVVVADLVQEHLLDGVELQPVEDHRGQADVPPQGHGHGGAQEGRQTEHPVERHIWRPKTVI